MKTFYITTPIYYSSGKPHVGTAYCSIACDVMARYKKARGYDVKFLTGNDEFGQKNEQAAHLRGLTPQQHLDDMAELFMNMARTVDVDYDIFWRTTDPRHQKAVQKIFKILYDNGDIYKGSYEGWYCTPDETFFTKLQLKDGKCPDCGRDVQKMQEEAYFFRMSKYQDRLLAHIEANPDFIKPESRKNEMVNNFLKPGLEDLCVSRTSFRWGIPVDFDPGHVVYVWVDALTNYANALGFLSEDDSEYKKYWPADIHMVGKEIVRFHTLIWPAILMSLGEPLPKQIFGHGWLTSEGKKMSKSFGNVIDPHLLVNRYGSDAVRYFLMREFAFGQDGDFRNEAMLTRMNADLANDLGNLLSRTVGMIDKYFGGVLPDMPDSFGKGAFDKDLEEMAVAMPGKVENLMDKMMFADALNEIWNVIRRANKYVDDNKPWELFKDEHKRGELANILYHLAETLRIVSIVIGPVMPKTPAAICEQFNTSVYPWDSAKTFGLYPKEIKVRQGPVLFPRLDIPKELKGLADEQQNRPASQAQKDNNAPEAPAPKCQTAKDPAAPEEQLLPQKPTITIDDFAKLDLKVGQVLECEAIEGTKLLKSKVRIGGEVKQIVSGIAKFYKPEQMINKKVVVVVNLKPVKLRGVLSEGMLLAASEGSGKEEVLSLITSDDDIADGAVVS